jgi:hypothetical protein
MSQYIRRTATAAALTVTALLTCADPAAAGPQLTFVNQPGSIPRW